MQRWAFATAVTAMLVALAAAGCDAGHTVVVQLQTDLAPGLEFDEVLVQATGVRSRRAGLRDDYGRPTQVAEFGGVATGTRFSVEIQLRRGGRDVLARRVERRISGDTIVAVIVTRNCLEVACPAPGSPVATECRGGVCVPPECDDRDREGCAPPQCDSDGDCSSAVACAVPRCSSGVCLATPDSTRCASGDLVCSPMLGCVPAVTPDAGAPDAGLPIDAAVPQVDAYLPPDAFTPGPTFTLRHLPRGGTAWSELGVGGDFPTDEIEAAFAPAGTGDMIVLTRTELFVFQLASRTFIERRPRDAAFPEVAGTAIQGASIVGTDVYLTSRDTWIYTWSHAARTGALSLFVRYEDLGADWRGPLTPPWWRMYAMFYVPDNADGWAQPDPTVSPCGADPVGNHLTYLSTDGFGPRGMTTTVYDASCFQFVNQSLYGDPEYRAFSLPGAPPSPWEIDAAEWSDGLWVFTSPE